MTKTEWFFGLSMEKLKLFNAERITGINDKKGMTHDEPCFFFYLLITDKIFSAAPFAPAHLRKPSEISAAFSR